MFDPVLFEVRFPDTNEDTMMRITIVITTTTSNIET